MQAVTTAWEDTNRSLFTRKANVTISIEGVDSSHSPFIRSDQIISLSHTKSGDILSGALTQDKITFVVDNTDDSFSYDNDDTQSKYKNARARLYDGFMNESGDMYDTINGGIYYISEFSINPSGKQVTFTAQSIIAFMTERYAGTYGIKSAKALLAKVIEQANESKGVPASNIQTDYDPILEDITMEILSTDDYSLAQILQLIANACGCVLYVDRLGKICIKKLESESTHYVLARKFLYQHLNVQYVERIGNVALQTNHGESIFHTDNTGDDIGGEISAANPILKDDIQSAAIIQHMYDTLSVGRKKFTANLRFDPSVDLFDIIVVPNGRKVNTAIVTDISVTYSGIWKGTIKAITVSNVRLDLRIKDLELLTLEQIENMTINEITGEGGE